MAKILDMPKLSPTMEEGVLSAWHKNEGDAVAVDDLLAEVETDKATMEFRSFDKGTVLKILVAAGTQVKLGQPVAILGSPGEDISALIAQVAPSAAGVTPVQGREPANQANPEVRPLTPTPKEPAPRKPLTDQVLDRTSHAPEPVSIARETEERVLASPYVRKVAREMGIELHGAHGTGKGGRVALADLES